MLVSEPDTGEIIEMASQDFIQVLRMLNFGEVAQRLTKDYNELLREVTRLNRVGSITFKLTLKPSNKGGAGVVQMELYPLVSVASPREEMGADTAFVGARGLQREHPKQREIEGLRAVEQENRAGARIADVEPRMAPRSAT